MRADRRRLVKAGLLALSLGSAQLARGASLLAVRIWPAPDYSRVTLESDAQLKTTQTFIVSPPRLAVDIEGLELNAALRELVGKVQASDPNIAGIRVGQYKPNTVRLVIDLKRSIAPQVFTLPPVAAYAHRLVLDLYPSEAIDPLAQFIQERAVAKALLPPATPPSTTPPTGLPAPTTAVNDPLGDLIARRSLPAAPLAAAGQAPLVPTQGHAPVTATTPATSTRSQDLAPPAGVFMDRPDVPARSPSPTPQITDRLIVVALDPGHTWMLCNSPLGLIAARCRLS